jgi:hypothetical protein
VSFGFLVAGFLSTMNAGRVALAAAERRPAPRELAIALLVAVALVVACVLGADPLLDWLSISPESWRIAAAVVLGAMGVRTIIWPGSAAPFGAILFTPELAAVSISPESWRIAAAVVLGAMGVRTIIWPGSAAPFGAILFTPELAAVSISFGADESAGRVLAAAAIGLLPALLAVRARRRDTGVLAAQFLAALQIVVAIALAVSGIRDV